MHRMNADATALLSRPTAIVAAGQHLLVVVAHTDDESFGCGSVIASAVDAGASMTVACATPGDRGHTRLRLDSTQLARQRLRELHLAADVLGVERVITLGYGDSGFDGPLPSGSLCAVDEAALVHDLVTVLADVRPDVVLVLDGCDGHRDHLRVRTATLAAVDRDSSEITVYESSLPNHLMLRWLDEMRKISPDAVYHAIDADSFGRPDHEITDVIETAHVRDRRDLAIAMHVSQASPFRDLSDELRTAFLDRDHLVRVR